MSVFLTFFIIAFALGAAMTDLLKGKIYNKYLLCFACASVIIRLAAEGIKAALMGLLISALIFALLIPLYMLRALGGGDIKLIALSAYFLTGRDIICICAHAFILTAFFGMIHILLKRIRGDYSLTGTAFGLPFCLSAVFNLIRASAF